MKHVNGHRNQRLFVSAIVGGTAIVLMLLGSAGIASADAVSKPPSVQKFPMWKLLPTESFATLMDKTIGDLRIGFYVYRDGGGDRRRVCIQQIAVQEEPGSGFSVTSGIPECGRLSSGQGFVAALGSFERHQTTAVSLIAAQQETSRIDIELVPGGVISRQSKALSPRQAKKARVMPLRYVALTIPNVGCLDAIKGFAAGGEQIFGTEARDCSEQLN